MKNLILPFIVIATLGLTACQAKPSPEPSQGTPSGIEQKSGDTTKSGVVSGSSGQYFLQVAGQAPLAIDSYSVDLSTYVGKSVTITGQYSGNTLFVGKIQ